jgi:hypothetical protein
MPRIIIALVAVIALALIVVSCKKDKKSKIGMWAYTGTSTGLFHDIDTLNKPVVDMSEPFGIDFIAAADPTVMYDNEDELFKMWYSSVGCKDNSGEEDIVNRISYATSPDGVTWEKYTGNPVFEPGLAGNGIPLVLRPQK